MIRVIGKIHIYAGLATFAQLIVYGIAGLSAMFHSGAERPQQMRSVQYLPFEAPPSATDRQVAALAFQTFQFPLSWEIPDWALKRTRDNHLLLDFYNINGIFRVTVLEEEHRVRVEYIRIPAGVFFEDIHAATPGDGSAPRLVRAWALWNEAAMWTLLLFCASGVWLWLGSRPRFVWAWVSFAAGGASMALLWSAFR